MTDQKDPNWVPPWEIMEGEGFISGNAFEVPVNEREHGQPVDIRLIKTAHVPGAYGGKFGIDVLDAKQLMANTGMNAKQLISAASVNDNSINEDQTVFGSGVLKLADAIVANKEQTALITCFDLDEQLLRDVQEQIDKGEHVFMPHGHSGHKLKFGEVSWNPEVKGLESITGPTVLPSSYPFNSVPAAVAKINKNDTDLTLTLPLTEEMKTLLSKQNVAGFLVDYSTQALRGRAFLAQFVDLPCRADVVFSQPLSYEDYSHLMTEYMLSMDMYDIPIFSMFAAELLLIAKGMDYDMNPYSTSVPKEYIERFLFVFNIRSDVTLLTRWKTFMDSMLAYGVYAIAPLKAHYKPEENFEHVIDENYVGVNVVSLLKVPHFAEWYFSLEVKYHTWIFPYQFNEPIFGGKTLRHYFRSKNNHLAGLFEGIALGHFKPSDVGFGVFTKGVFAPDYPIGEFDFDKKVT